MSGANSGGEAPTLSALMIGPDPAGLLNDQTLSTPGEDAPAVLRWLMAQDPLYLYDAHHRVMQSALEHLWPAVMAFAEPRWWPLQLAGQSLAQQATGLSADFQASLTPERRQVEPGAPPELLTRSAMGLALAHLHSARQGRSAVSAGCPSCGHHGGDLRLRSDSVDSRLKADRPPGQDAFTHWSLAEADWRRPLTAPDLRSLKALWTSSLGFKLTAEVSCEACRYPAMVFGFTLPATAGQR